MTHPPEGIVSFDIGFGFIDEHQGLGSIYGRRHDGLTVDEAMQPVEDMGLGWNACLQSHLRGQEHGILIVLQDQGQDVDHLAVTARLLEPPRQSVRKRIELARPIRNLERRLDRVTAQILADGVPGQAGPAADLPDR